MCRWFKRPRCQLSCQPYQWYPLQLKQVSGLVELFLATVFKVNLIPEFTLIRNSAVKKDCAIEKLKAYLVGVALETALSQEDLPLMIIASFWFICCDSLFYLVLFRALCQSACSWNR